MTTRVRDCKTGVTVSQCHQRRGRVEPGQAQSEAGQRVGVQPGTGGAALHRLSLPAAGRTGPRPVQLLPHRQR